MDIQELLSFLEIKDAQSWEHIQRHVRHLLRMNHPDVHQENKFYYEEKTKKILRAYELLKKLYSEGQSLPMMPPPDPEPVVFPSSFLLFRVALKTFAFPVKNVKEVVRTQNLDSGGLFLGKIKIRGEETPVFSLSYLLFLPDLQPPLFDSLPACPGRVLVVISLKKKAGFLVDSVDNVTEILEQEFVTHSAHEPLKKYVHRMAMKEGNLVMILSPEKIFQELV